MSEKHETKLYDFSDTSNPTLIRNDFTQVTQPHKIIHRLADPPIQMPKFEYGFGFIRLGSDKNAAEAKVIRERISWQLRCDSNKYTTDKVGMNHCIDDEISKEWQRQLVSYPDYENKITTLIVDVSVPSATALCEFFKTGYDGIHYPELVHPCIMQCDIKRGPWPGRALEELQRKKIIQL